MKFETLSQEEKMSYLEQRRAARKSGNKEELERLVKLFEIDDVVARGIKLTWGSEEIQKMKNEGYSFSEKI